MQIESCIVILTMAIWEFHFQQRIDFEHTLSQPRRDNLPKTDWSAGSDYRETIVCTSVVQAENLILYVRERIA
jgi:hypothetical protein